MAGLHQDAFRSPLGAIPPLHAVLVSHLPAISTAMTSPAQLQIVIGDIHQFSRAIFKGPPEALWRAKANPACV